MTLSIQESEVALIVPLDGLEKRLSETTLAQLSVVMVLPESTPLAVESAVDVRDSRVTLARSLVCVNDDPVQLVVLVFRSELGEVVGTSLT